MSPDDDDILELTTEAADPSPAPETEVTAAPETAPTDTPPEDQPAEETPRTFTQEEVDDILSKRLAREQRKLERQARDEHEAQQQKPPYDGELRADMFATPEDYAEALAERIATERETQRDTQRVQRATLEAYQEREEEVRDKYEDFEQVAYNPQLSITEYMAQTIQASEIGPEVIYWLGMNPKEASRITNLPPLLQAREIGRIESVVEAAPPVKRTSSAPAPIEPVSPRSNGTPAYDTTDPRSVGSMSTSDWIAAERQRQTKRTGSNR
tara:strand:+ start:2895 stop:3701 length:807 start_codon:yes stop_codon:yes gene_type:complete